MPRRVPGILAACVLLVSAGCRTTTPARTLADTGRSGPGPLVQAYPLPADSVRQAAREALVDLEFEPQSDPGRDSGSVVGRSPVKGTATLTLLTGESTTLVAYRGDQPETGRALLDRIGVRLGTRPPAPIPVDAPEPSAGRGRLSRDAVSDAVMLRGEDMASYRDTPIP